MTIVDKTLDRKFADLKKLVSGYGSLIVAYSGGVDSTFLAAVAHEVLGFNTLSVTSRSPSVAPEELEAAIAVAKTRGWRHLVVDTNENLAHQVYPSMLTWYYLHHHQPSQLLAILYSLLPVLLLLWQL